MAAIRGTVPLTAVKPAPANTTPMPAVDRPLVEPQMTAAAVTATTVAEPPARGSVGMVVTAAVIALALAGGVGFFLMQRHEGAATAPDTSGALETTAAPATSTAPTPTATPTSESSETTSSEPATSASAETSAEPPEPSATAVAAPPRTNTVGPAPPPPTTTEKAPPPPPPPPPKPPKMCPRINPETGLMEEVPCH